MEKNDIQILEQFRNNSTREAGFNLLVKKYQQRIYWHIRKIIFNHEDAQDVVQNVLIKIWTHIDTVREEAKLCSWVYRIATNETFNFISQKKRRFAFSFSANEEYLSNTIIANQYFDGEEIIIRLQKAILCLPKKQRIVFNMRYFDETRYEEMSQKLSTSVGALKASYHIAVKKIENYLFQN